MMRAFALGIGITVAILGVECLLIERATFTEQVVASKQRAAAEKAYVLGQTAPQRPPSKDLVPPEWAPWTMMSVGAVIILYSFTIPKRVAAAT